MTINVQKTSCVAANINSSLRVFFLNISYLIWRDFRDFVTQFGGVLLPNLARIL